MNMFKFLLDTHCNRIGIQINILLQKFFKRSRHRHDEMSHHRV